MEIDLTDPSQNTIQNFKSMLRSYSDDRNTQFRVTQNGIFYISLSTGNKDLEGVLFRLETNIKGNGYVGIEAAKDEIWVQRLYKAINQNWPNPQASFIDHF